MNIETLQIKRVTGNWDTHKSYAPEPGEPVLIALTDSKGFNVVVNTMDNGVTLIEAGGTLNNPLLVIGTSEAKDLQTLIDQRQFYVDIGTIGSMIRGSIAECVETTSPPRDISNVSAIGELNTLSRADHTHKITKDTVTTVLKDTNDFAYHGIKFSKNAPTKDTPGNIGDIIIVYEDK